MNNSQNEIVIPENDNDMNTERETVTPKIKPTTEPNPTKDPTRIPTKKPSVMPRPKAELGEGSTELAINKVVDPVLKGSNNKEVKNFYTTSNVIPNKVKNV